MKKLTLALLLLIVLSLTACTGFSRGQPNVLVDYYTGTQGVQLEFLQGAPPEDLNEGQNFDVQVLVHNLGAYDITDKKTISLEIVHDSALLQELDVGGQGNYLRKPYTLQLHGKSYAFQNGEQDFFSVGRYVTAPVRSSFEKAHPTLYGTICYPYQTSFATEICVDTDITNTDVRTQACETQPVRSYPGGQGAPIAVTQVRTSFESRGPYALPTFTFTIENLGDGFFHKSSADRCDEPTTETMYVVDFSAALGNVSLTCAQEQVFLEEGKGEVNCYVSGDGFLLTQSNYLSVLTAQIHYQYTETFSSTSLVKRQTPYYAKRNDSDTTCAPWETYDSTRRNCISLCEYCTTNPRGPECRTPEKLSTNENVEKVVLPGSSCIYTKQECATEGDNCIKEEGKFCVPGLYCGVPSCVYNAKKNDGPTLGLEPGADETKVTWFCSDDETTPTLQASCGCLEESWYAVTAKGVECPDSLSSYSKVNGYTSQSLTKTYFTVDRADIGTDVDTFCVFVEDAQGKFITKRLRID